MEVVVRDAMEALAQGKESLDPRQVLGLRDRLTLVDSKFGQLRREVSRLNGLLAEQKDANDALRAHNIKLMDEVRELRTAVKGSAIAPKSKKSKKKKTTTKKKLTTKKK